VGAINATAMAALAHLPVARQVDTTHQLRGEMRKADVLAPIVGVGGLRTVARLFLASAPTERWSVRDPKPLVPCSN
jgi:hypothetical protein